MKLSGQIALKTIYWAMELLVHICIHQPNFEIAYTENIIIFMAEHN